MTAIDGDHAYFLAGPWPEHAQALAEVEAVRRFAERTDLRAVWMAFGTARKPSYLVTWLRVGLLRVV